VYPVFIIQLSPATLYQNVGKPGAWELSLSLTGVRISLALVLSFSLHFLLSFLSFIPPIYIPIAIFKTQSIAHFYHLQTTLFVTMFKFQLLSRSQHLTSSLKSRPAPPLLSPGVCHNTFSALTSPLLTHLSSAQNVHSSVLKSPGSHHSDEPVNFAIVVRDFALQPRVESSTLQAQTQRQRAHSNPSDSLLQGFLVQEVVASSAVDVMSPSKSHFHFAQKDAYRPVA